MRKLLQGGMNQRNQGRAPEARDAIYGNSYMASVLWLLHEAMPLGAIVIRMYKIAHYRIRVFTYQAILGISNIQTF